MAQVTSPLGHWHHYFFILRLLSTLCKEHLATGQLAWLGEMRNLCLEAVDVRGPSLSHHMGVAEVVLEELIQAELQLLG